MDANPLLVNEGAQLLPPAPVEIKCPGDYKKYEGACFKFGAHSSYEMAQTSCDAAGARLADVEQTYVKYIRDQVRTMGGNDFWIGSFTNNGRIFRKKGRTSCPLLRGQMINDAFYGLVDCNSANRYICQKYGQQETKPTFNQGGYSLNNGDQKGVGFNIVSSTTTKTTEAAKTDGEGGGTSPVIYAVISVVIIILVLVALKLLFNRYMNKKKNTKKAPKNVEAAKPPEKNGNGIVLSSKYRQGPASKPSSVDSAVPPSNPSPSLEKGHHPESGKDTLLKEQENHRLGRPRVNGPEPTRPPPNLIETDLKSSRSTRRAPEEREYHRKPPRRTYSDPRSEYGRDPYSRGERRRRRRRRSYYSDYSGSDFDSDSDDSDYYGRRHGPRKVYQRYPSEYRTYREPQHYHFGPPRRESHYDPYGHYGKGHYGRGHRRSNHGNFYHNEGHRRQSRGPPQHRYGSYGRPKTSRRDRARSHMPTVSGRVSQQQGQERQYFPDPPRLMSWTDQGELKETPASTEQLVHVNTRSFPREPIWVNRQIHQQPKAQKQKRTKKSKNKDDNHIYESLDEVKRNKQLKKAAKRNKSRKNNEDQFTRNASFRASVRSAVSIQSRRLPSPPR